VPGAALFETLARLADLQGIEISAHQFQQWAPKREEARVIAIGQQVYAVTIRAGSAAVYVDWRADHAALSYERIDRSPEASGELDARTTRTVRRAHP